MGLFGGFKGRSAGPQIDRILSPEQVREELASDYGSDTSQIIFVLLPSRSLSAWEIAADPMLVWEFAKDPKLGMLYGTGSGCAYIRWAALRKVQEAVSRPEVALAGGDIRSCRELVETLNLLGFSVKQDPRLTLDLLP
jgi:hypothetical protein